MLDQFYFLFFALQWAQEVVMARMGRKGQKARIAYLEWARNRGQTTFAIRNLMIGGSRRFWRAILASWYFLPILFLGYRH